MLLVGHINTLGMLLCSMGDGTKVSSWEHLWLDDKSLSEKFLNIYTVVKLRNSVISLVLVFSSPSIS